MFRVSAALALVAALSLAAGQQAAVEWRAIAPGVEHAQVRRDAPWNINLVRVDLVQARLDVVHAGNDAVGLETLSTMAARANAISAINGGYFRGTGTFAGDSTGTLQIDGKLLSEPDRGRAAIGFLRSSQGTGLVMGHVTWEASISASGNQRRLDGINRPRGRNEVVVFTAEFGESTLTDETGSEAIVRGGGVEEVREKAGSSRIPTDGFVVSATGTAQQWLRTRLRKGAQVSVSTSLRPVDRGRPNPWPTAEDVLGAGPKIVTAGKPDITDRRERMVRTFATDRHPRSAIAALGDGRALLAVVDGRQPSHSIGMTLAELATLLIEFGAVEAINLDGGGSTTMVVNGAIVNRPSDVIGERPISDAILVLPSGR